MRILHVVPVSLGLAILGCSSPSVPDVFTDSKALPKIYPDYTGVTIPVNIAPLTFELDEEADEMVARYSAGSVQMVFADKAQPDEDQWQLLTQQAKGSAISVDVYARKAGQKKRQGGDTPRRRQQTGGSVREGFSLFSVHYCIFR